MRLLIKLGAVVALVCVPIRSAAQYQTIELADVQLARSLGAAVRDPQSVPIPKVLVQEFSAGWKTVLRSTSTDVDGKFSFSPVRVKSVYFIQISAPGFDPLRFRLHVDAKHGASLELKLVIAT